MAVGNDTYKGLAVPLHGESEIVQQDKDADIITITGAASQAGDFLVLRDSDEAEKFAIGAGGAIDTMILGTVALGSLASDASATVALTGLTTDHVVAIFPRAAHTSGAVPVVWASAADKLGYGAGGAVCGSQTVNVWAFKTA
jgi:hypothetical protein